MVIFCSHLIGDFPDVVVHVAGFLENMRQRLGGSSDTAEHGPPYIVVRIVGQHEDVRCSGANTRIHGVEITQEAGLFDSN